MNEDFLKLVKEALTVDRTASADEDDIAASELAEVPPGVVDLALKKYVFKKLEALYPEPIRRVEGKLTFGQWLELSRVKARLRREEVAAALNNIPTFIENIETGKIRPPNLSVKDAADLLSLFRLHMDAVPQLVTNSVAENKRISSRASKNPRQKPAQGFPTNMNITALNPLDFYADVPEDAGTGDESKWLRFLSVELQKRKLEHLLS